MDCYHITGGNPLKGTYQLKGAKNSVLPIMAACVLTKGVCVLEHCPNLSDVQTMIQILEGLGCCVTYENDSIVLDSRFMNEEQIFRELGGKLRSSIFLMGPMLARFGSVTICKPGGCAIGERPIDLHVSCLQALGAVVEQKSVGTEEEIRCTATRLRGAVISLRYPSVGATENAMMAAVMAEGETCIQNSAREPEIEDLQNFLNDCGAQIRGAGTGEIVICGGTPLHGVHYEVIPDRIETGTMLLAAAVTGGEVYLERARPDHLTKVCALMEQMGCRLRKMERGLWLEAPVQLRGGLDIQTKPYPGFPTDLQSAFLTVLTVAMGTSKIKETIFENRFKTVEDLKKMGASIAVRGQYAMVTGVSTLWGAEVTAGDLRGGAALVLAGLAAQGETVVRDIYHIDRGYDKLERGLCALGAQIERKG